MFKLKDSYKRIYLLFSAALLSMLWNYNRDCFSDLFNSFLVTSIIIYYIFVFWYILNKSTFKVLFITVSKKDEFNCIITDRYSNNYCLKDLAIFNELKVGNHYYIYLNYYDSIIKQKEWKD